MARRPLNRPMFRVPGVSRQPAGILASSPQLMQAAQRNMMSPIMQPPGVMPMNVLQPASAQGPLTGTGTSVGPDMFGVQRRPVSALTAPPVAELGSNALPEPKPEPSGFSTFSQEETTLPAGIDDRTTKRAQPIADSMNRLRTATNNILEGVPTRDDEILAGQSINQIYSEAVDATKEGMPKLSDYNLADFEDMALESLGYDQRRGPKEVADEDRKTSFWLSLIKAGLAVAAGESPDALTNIARGLSFGVESFGRDLKDISAAEREENRAVAAAKLGLLQDQRSVDVADRAAKIQAAQLKVNLAQSIRGEELQMALKEVDLALGYTQMENSLFSFVAQQDANWAEIDFNKSKFEQTLKATLAAQTPEFIRELGVAGYVVATEEGGTVDYSDPNSYKLTPEGTALFNQWVANKGSTKLTNLARAADAASESLVVGSIDFSDVGENAAKLASRTQIQIGVANMPTDSKARAAIEAPLFRTIPGAKTTNRALIEEILMSNNVQGIELYGNVSDGAGGVKFGRIDPAVYGGDLEDAFEDVTEIRIAKVDAGDDDELATPAGDDGADG